MRHTLRGRRAAAVGCAQASTFVVGLYTGYFGAASGVLFLALVGLVSVASLHELNAAKNVLVGVANAVATVIFVARRAGPLADGAGARDREHRGRRGRHAARAPRAGAAPAGGDRARRPRGGGAARALSLYPTASATIPAKIAARREHPAAAVALVEHRDPRDGADEDAQLRAGAT